MEKIVIIGSGPAAYTAALFSIQFQPLLFEGEIVGDIGPGGQLTTTTDVDNFPGFPKGIQGPELMKSMKKQAVDKGLRVISKTVTGLKKLKDRFVIHTSDSQYEAKSVILGTGASAKRLYVPGTGKDEFWQKGISACAVCDGFFFKDETVAIIGGGDSAMEETIYMSNLASKVYLIHRRDEFRARKDMLQKVKNLENVEIITPAILVSAHGTDFLESVKLKNLKNENIFELKTNGLFFAIGHTPNTSFLDKSVKVDDMAYVFVDERMHTTVEGLFACGDVYDSKYKQAVTAASSGCVAAIECIKFLNCQ